MKFKKKSIIASKKLRIEDIPKEDDDYDKISEFALTYDIKKEFNGYKYSNDIDKAGEHSTINELRCHLYVEQRRWNHLQKDPDKKTMEKIRKTISVLREKISKIQGIKCL